MNKNSDTNINDIINRLRKKIETEEHVENQDLSAQSPKHSPEQLLQDLRNSFGEGKGNETEEPQVDIYDISGYEIDPEENSLPSQETVDVSDVTLEPEALSAEEVREQEMVEEAETTVEANGESSQTASPFEEESPEEEAIFEDDGRLPWEDSGNALQSTEMEDLSSSCSQDDDEMSCQDNEEAVRKQVELFVEKTLAPEEEFDYFAQIDQRRSKDKIVEPVAAQEITTDSDLSPVQEEVHEESMVAEVVVEEEDTTQETVADEATLPTEAVANEENITSEAVDNEENTSVLTPDENSQDNELVVAESESSSEEESTESEPQVDEEQFDLFFFNGHPEKHEETVEPAAASTKANALDDTDINLLLALGKKRELEDAVGFVRVREAKNNFYDPKEEEPIRRNVFAYNGQEYRSHDERDGVKASYQKDKKTVYYRLAFSILFVLSFFFLEYASAFHVDVATILPFLSNGLYYYGLLLVLVVLNILVSAKNLWFGLVGFFTIRPTHYTPLSVVAIIQILYLASVPFIFPNQSIPTYCLVFSVFVLFSVIGDILRLTKEMLTFDIISDPCEKFSLEKAEDSAEHNREIKVLQTRNFTVERVCFVGKYFKRTSQRPPFCLEYFFEFLAILLAAVFLSVISAVNSGEFASVLSSFMFAVMLCLPLQPLVEIYPYTRLSKKLYRHQSAIVGERVDVEYVGANTVYLDDMQMFGRHGVSISGLRIYNDKDFYNVLYHAMAVFSQVEGPLRYVLENSSHEIKPAKSVKLLNISASGFEAIVDGTNTVLVGNVNFMRSHGFFPKRNEEDDKKAEDGELSILYMTIGSSLCAKFYMKYTITHHFEKFVTEMAKNNTKVGIRTLDPNVTEKMISLLRKDKEIPISVIRPALNDLIPLGKRSDSGIITAKGPHMISKILAECLVLKKMRRLCSIVRFASISIGILITLLLILTNTLGNIPPIFQILFHLLWLIPMVVFAKTKIK